MTKFKNELDTVFFQNLFDYCTNVSVEYVDKLQHSIDQLKNKKQLEEQVFRPEEMPKWLVELLTSKNESVLLKTQDFSLISSWLGHKNVQFRLLYRGSRDGMSARSFHQKCDGKANTVLVARSKNHGKVFGAFTVPKWMSHAKGQYQQDSSAFLFSITNQTKHAVYQHPDNAQYSKEAYGPTYGGGHDLFISPNFTQCNANLGYTYQPVVGAYQANETRNHLAGAFTFDLEDIEVFQVDF